MLRFSCVCICVQYAFGNASVRGRAPSVVPLCISVVSTLLSPYVLLLLLLLLLRPPPPPLLLLLLLLR